MSAVKDVHDAAMHSGAPKDTYNGNDNEDSDSDALTMTTFDVRRGMADLRKMFHAQHTSMYTERMPRLQHLSAADFCVKVVLTTLAKRRARSALKKTQAHQPDPAAAQEMTHC